MKTSPPILIVSQSFFPAIGGVSTFLVGLISGLLKRGYKVHVLHFKVSETDSFKEMYPSVIQHEVDPACFPNSTLKGYAEFKEAFMLEMHGLTKKPIEEITKINGYQKYSEINQEFLKRAIDIINKEDIQFLHIHDYQLALMLEGVKNMKNIKKFFSLHTPILPTYTNVILEWFKSTITLADVTIVSIPEYQQILTSFFPSLGNKIVTIPPFIDNKLQDALSKSESYKVFLPKNEFLVSSIQRFDSKSGHRQLVLGFLEFLNRGYTGKLVLVGGPSFTDTISRIRHKYFLEIKNLVKKLHLENNVIFTGAVPYQHIRYIYEKSSVFSILSKNECFCLSLTEALSRKIPVIVTNVGGLRYQVKPDHDGKVVTVDNFKEVADALESLYVDKDLCKKLTKNAYKKYKAELSPEVLIDKYDALFRKYY